jgi:hypothetical protein
VTTRHLRIRIGDLELEAELKDTRTARAIWDVLPLRAKANTWGKEIYFSIPVHLDQEEGQETVVVGDLGYWPQGDAFCIFFGPTPASRGDEIRPASAVTVFGRVVGDARVLETVTDGADVLVNR